MIKKTLLFSLSFASFCILANIASSPSASAIISDQFIDPINAGGNAEVKVLVESTDAVSVPDIKLKWFLQPSQLGNRQIVMQGFCAAGQTAAYVEFSRFNAGTGLWELQTFPVGVIGVGNYTQLPWIGNGCAGNDLVIGNIPRGWFVPQTVGANNLYPGYEVMLVQVHVANPTPFAGNINQFRADADTGLISQAEVGTAASQSSGMPAAADAFAVLGDYDGLGNRYGYDVTFNFAPSCDAPTGNNYWLHWRDLDYNQSYGNQTYWILTDLTTGVVQNGPAPPNNPLMGGSNAHASAQVSLIAGHNYAWEWRNVNHLNTIHVWMPFSELQPLLSCAPPPGPTDVTITGRVVSVANASVGIPNIAVNICESYKPVTDANGFFSFTRPQNDDFCVRVDAVDRPPGSTASIRPAGEAYWTCAAFPAGNVIPNSCPSPDTYECQAAGADVGVVNCGGTVADFDRASNDGYVIAISPAVVTAPIVSCTAATISLEYGVVGALSVVFTNSSPATAAPNVVISAIYSFPGGTPSGGVSYNPGTTVPRGGGTSTISQSASYAAAGTYTYTATITYNDGVNPPGSLPCPGIVNVYGKPYLKAFGADVSAGWNFKTGTTCAAPATTGSIYAFTSGSGGSIRGASGQFGVQALLSINQFYSGSQRTTLNTPQKGTTFANVNPADTFGGNFGGAGACGITDYFNSTQIGVPTPRPNLTAAAASAPAGISQFTMAPGNIFGAPSVSIREGTQIAVYIDGDVFINGNVLYQAASTRADLPYFALIVRGNIFIGAGVTRLDGLYVAQPHTDPAIPDKGKIYTCALAAGSLYPSNQMAANCGNPLSINGAVIAKTIKFYRTRGTLQSSVSRERPTSFNNGDPGTSAAEIINFTPEMYMATSPLRDPDANQASPKYDSIFSLPPIY